MGDVNWLTGFRLPSYLAEIYIGGNVQYSLVQRGGVDAPSTVRISMVRSNVAIATVGTQAMRAGLTNPVDALRCE